MTESGPPSRRPVRSRSLTGVASTVALVALGVLFLPGPDVWRYLGGLLFLLAAAVVVIDRERR
jgi:hypothetical protein